MSYFTTDQPDWFTVAMMSNIKKVCQNSDDGYLSFHYVTKINSVF